MMRQTHSFTRLMGPSHPHLHQNTSPPLSYSDGASDILYGCGLYYALFLVYVPTVDGPSACTSLATRRTCTSLANRHRIRLQANTASRGTFSFRAHYPRRSYPLTYARQRFVRLDLLRFHH